jgi:hypothetical protein
MRKELEADTCRGRFVSLKVASVAVEGRDSSRHRLVTTRPCSGLPGTGGVVYWRHVLVEGCFCKGRFGDSRRRNLKPVLIGGAWWQAALPSGKVARRQNLPIRVGIRMQVCSFAASRKP